MRFRLVSTCSLALMIVAYSQAINIIGTFVPGGGSLPGGPATVNPPVTSGGGNLQTIFNTAAGMWEQAIGDTFTVSISYGWTAIASGGVLGQHTLLSQGGSPNRELSAKIEFDGDGTSSFFADSSPADNSEYLTYNETSQDFGGGLMNKGRVFTGATGPAATAIDLLSVAIHEIGHALGLSSANTSFIAGNGDLDVDVTSPRPFAGSSLPTVSGAHLNISTSMMFPSVSTGVRKYLSDADIIANMEISKFSQFGTVPEPASMVALGVGFFALIRRKRAKK